MTKLKRPRNGSADSKYLTTDQMCERYDCDRSTIDRKEKAGIIAPKMAGHVGKQNQYLRSLVDAFDERRTPVVSDLLPDNAYPIDKVIDKARKDRERRQAEANREQQKRDRAAALAARTAAQKKEDETRERMKSLAPPPAIPAAQLAGMRGK